MPVAGEYTWSETDGHVELAIPLKGVSSKKVDVFTASTILKVSYAPFLLDLNLRDEIDEESSRAVLKNGTLRIRLAKREPRSWGQLCFEGSKEAIRRRRKKALDERDAKVQKQMEKVASKKVEEERMVFRQHMELEEKERRRMDEIKAAEKKQAEEAVHDTFSRLQEGNSSGNNLQPSKNVHFQSDDDASKEPPQDCSDGDDDEPESELPPPRKPAHATFRHTPRLFKTPSRESTVKQEQEFIMKNRSNLKKNALLNDVGIGDADPVWLNAKGDEFVRKGDFCSAINAYTEALVADEGMVQALASRAACYLHLREGACCIKDCLAVVEKGDEVTSLFPFAAERARFLKDIHMRLALAHCLGEEYEDGKVHFEKAQQLVDEEDETVTRCKSYLETLVDAARWKDKADARFAKGDLDSAKEFYTDALLVDKSFVKALMNRAACRLALGDGPGCIDDCTQALELLDGNKPKPQDWCVLAAILVPKPDVRRKWVVTLLCRRAAAKRLGEEYRGALADLVKAKDTMRRNDDIDSEAVDQSIASLKKEMA